jgi:hypothetical protein
MPSENSKKYSVKYYYIFNIVRIVAIGARIAAAETIVMINIFFTVAVIYINLIYFANYSGRVFVAPL